MNTRLKKYLFWTVFPFACIAMLVYSFMLGWPAQCIMVFGEWCFGQLSKFEGWALEYKKHGWVSLGGSMWKREDSNR